MARDTDLFGAHLPDVFATARDRYGLWPLTLWDLDHQDPFMKAMKEAVGDTGEARGLAATEDRYGLRYKKVLGNAPTMASIFNPVLGTLILNFWGPRKPVNVLDPFAGGGARAILCAKRGHNYTGCELREEECYVVQARCHANGVPCSVVGSDLFPLSHPHKDLDTDPAAGTVTIIVGDCRTTLPRLKDNAFQFLLTCPPYWTLEVYSKGEGDLSSDELPYRDYVEAMQATVGLTRPLLQKGSPSCWVIGMTRGKDGNLKPLHHVLADAHKANGFYYAEEVVLAMRNTGSIQRVGNFEKGKKHLIRVHEYLEVFVRG